MSLFQDYGAISGQHLRLEKCIFFAGSMPPARQLDLRHFLGFNGGRLPFNYLGVPFSQCKPSTTHLQLIADKIKSKLSAWKGSMLSIMGRVQLVKSIIHGMMSYSFHVYMWPIALLKSLDRCIRNFIWSGNMCKRKLVIVAWQKLCSPVSSGGLRLRSLRAINEAAMLKLRWGMLSSQSHWSLLLKCRFLRHNKPVGHYAKSSIWPGVRQFINSTLEGSYWHLGDGSNIKFWKDQWLS